jgi:hypothetical protein
VSALNLARGLAKSLPFTTNQSMNCEKTMFQWFPRSGPILNDKNVAGEALETDSPYPFFHWGLLTGAQFQGYATAHPCDWSCAVPSRVLSLSAPRHNDGPRNGEMGIHQEHCCDHVFTTERAQQPAPERISIIPSILRTPRRTKAARPLSGRESPLCTSATLSSTRLHPRSPLPRRGSLH